jgi:hypothetical protein
MVGFQGVLREAFRPVGIVQQMPRNPPNHRNRAAAPAHPDHEPEPSGCGGTPRASRGRSHRMTSGSQSMGSVVSR